MLHHCSDTLVARLPSDGDAVQNSHARTGEQRFRSDHRLFELQCVEDVQ